MFVFLGVTVAFLAAQAARLGARLKGVADYGFVAAGAARGNRRGGKAQIRTIEIQADTLGEIRNRLLTKAGIRTDRASLGAVVAKVDAPDEYLVDVALNVRMARNHLLGMHAGLLC